MCTMCQGYSFSQMCLSWLLRGNKVIQVRKTQGGFYLQIQIQLSSDELLFVTYTIIQSIMRSEMCSLHLTHPSVHTWSSGQPTVAAPGRSSRGLPAGARIRTHNLGLPRVSSPTLYPLGQRLANDYLNLVRF